jgi:hypothetical protein
LGGVQAYLTYLAASHHRQRIQDFFLGDKWYLKHAWRSKQAQDATYDLAIKAILALGGVSEGKKFEGDGPAPIFAIGLGSFDTQTGLSSKHPQLEKRFIIKVCCAYALALFVFPLVTSAPHH